MVRELDKIYVPMNEALDMARQADWPSVIRVVAQLTGQSEELVAAAVSPLVELGPSVAVARSMPTATCENWLLAQVARQLGLTPVQWALVKDIYVDFNPEKRLMLRHKVIFDQFGLNGRRVRDQCLTTRQFRLNGLPMDEIQVACPDGQYMSLVDFHRSWWENSRLGGVVVNASHIATQLLGDQGGHIRKELWYPVFFSLMSANLIFLENYSPRFCKDLWPVVSQVWDHTRRLGLHPRLVRLPLTPEIDWFLERPELTPPRQVQDLLPLLVS